eukprot:s2470_g12.t1
MSVLVSRCWDSGSRHGACQIRRGSFCRFPINFGEGRASCRTAAPVPAFVCFSSSGLAQTQTFVNNSSCILGWLIGRGKPLLAVTTYLTGPADRLSEKTKEIPAGLLSCHAMSGGWQYGGISQAHPRSIAIWLKHAV